MSVIANWLPQNEYFACVCSGVQVLLETKNLNFYCPQFAKVMFSQVSVCPQGGHAWWGACMVGGVCSGGGMHGVGHACKGDVCVAGETATAVGSTHPTRMYSCIRIIIFPYILPSSDSYYFAENLERHSR